MGKRLRSLRGKKTQEEVAKAIGVSFSAYTKYEMGIRIPRDEVKIRIANYYHKTVQYIFLLNKFTDSEQKGEQCKSL